MKEHTLLLMVGECTVAYLPKEAFQLVMNFESMVGPIKDLGQIINLLSVSKIPISFSLLNLET
jgi:hypothetical protein